MSPRRSVCLAGLAALWLTLPAEAAGFRFDASNSELAFTGDWSGEPVPGVFGRFSGRADFDASAPLKTRFRTEIEVASLDTDDEQRDEAMRGPDFFDTDAHPRAVWESAGDCSASGAALSCPGQLTLKDVSKPVPLTITPAADGGGVEGRAELSRTAFGVGTGDWADTDTIADAVAIRFTLRWKPE
jgi:polyisoprenoid-binding protein YceI